MQKAPPESDNVEEKKDMTWFLINVIFKENIQIEKKK